MTSIPLTLLFLAGAPLTILAQDPAIADNGDAPTGLAPERIERVERGTQRLYERNQISIDIVKSTLMTIPIVTYMRAIAPRVAVGGTIQWAFPHAYLGSAFGVTGEFNYFLSSKTWGGWFVGAETGIATISDRIDLDGNGVRDTTVTPITVSALIGYYYYPTRFSATFTLLIDKVFNGIGSEHSSSEDRFILNRADGFMVGFRMRFTYAF